MTQDKFDQAIGAITDLMHAELDGTERQRFARVNRISAIAQKLQLECARSVRDVASTKDPEDGFRLEGAEHFGVVGNYLMGEEMAGRPLLGHPEQNDYKRQLLMMATPIVEAYTAHERARTRAAQATELNELLATREQLLGLNPPASLHQIQPLEARITDLLALTNPKDTAPNDQTVRMVPTESLRGHPPGSPGPIPDQDDAPWAVAAREDRGEGFAGPRREVGAIQGFVGEFGEARGDQSGEHG